MSDIEFLKEIREHVEKGRKDVTHHEMALKMIDDWIDEMQVELIDIGDGAKVHPAVLAAILPDEDLEGEK